MLPRLLRILKTQRYEVFEKPFQLNIVGVRSAETNSNRFDDEIHVLFRDDKLKWYHYKYTVTTDPGTYWLQNPSMVEGTAILKAGQYKDTYMLGLHKGQYKALVQKKPVTVIRDYDRNALLDFYNGREFTGMFGINIHRASTLGITKSIEKWSAGCQVFQNHLEFMQFLTLCERHRQRYGNGFTYTLIDIRMMKRYKKRMWIYGAGAIGALATIGYLILK